MASTSDVASTSRATSLSSSINSPPPTLQDVPEVDTAKWRSKVHELREYAPTLGFKCRKCDYRCFTDEQWEYHYYHSHREHQYRCTEQRCAFKYSYECEQFLHVMKVHKPGTYYCIICEIPLFTKVDSKTHAYVHHSMYKESYLDSEDERFEPIPDSHLDLEVGDLDFNLDLEVGDNQPNLLPLQQKTRLRDPVYRCFKCTSPDLSMSFRELLKHHKEKHSPAYPCPVCPEVYSDFNLLNLHKILHYTMAQDYYCDICNIRFTNRKQFDTHSFKAHCKRLYTCDQCGKSFAYGLTLNRHKKREGH